MALKDLLHVMVVDDMTVSRVLLEQTLTEIGIHNVLAERDPAVALRRLAANPVHLVIADYNMPGMDGLQLLETLRSNKLTQNIGFILVTGRPDRDVLLRGQKLGMNNYLAKPFSAQALRVCIEKVVGPLG